MAQNKNINPLALLLLSAIANQRKKQQATANGTATIDKIAKSNNPILDSARKSSNNIAANAIPSVGSGPAPTIKESFEALKTGFNVIKKGAGALSAPAKIAFGVSIFNANPVVGFSAIASGADDIIGFGKAVNPILDSIRKPEEAVANTQIDTKVSSDMLSGATGLNTYSSPSGNEGLSVASQYASYGEGRKSSEENDSEGGNVRDSGGGNYN